MKTIRFFLLLLMAGFAWNAKLLIHQSIAMILKLNAFVITIGFLDPTMHFDYMMKVFFQIHKVYHLLYVVLK